MAFVVRQLELDHRARGVDVAEGGPEAAVGVGGASDLELVRPRVPGRGERLLARVLRVIHRDRAQERPPALDAAVEDVDVPEEVHHEGGRGMVEDLLGRADLLDLALVHDHHPIGDLERFLLIVGHEDAGDVDLVVQAAEPAAAAPGAPSRRARRTARRAAARCGSAASARARATRWRWPPESCARVAVGQPVELDELEQLHDALADLAPGASARWRTRKPKPMFSNTVMWRKSA